MTRMSGHVTNVKEVDETAVSDIFIIIGPITMIFSYRGGLTFGGLGFNTFLRQLRQNAYVIKVSHRLHARNCKDINIFHTNFK